MDKHQQENESPSDRRSERRDRDDIGRRLRQAEMLLATYRRLASVDTLDKVLRIIIEIMVSETGAEWGSIFLNDEETGELYARIQHGGASHEIRVLNGEGLVGHVFQTGESLVVGDAYQNELFNPKVDQVSGLTTRNLLAVPIRNPLGKVIGVCEVVNKLVGEFTEENIEVLASLATQACISLESAQFAEQMELSRQQELDFLDVVAGITSEINLSSVLQKVMRETTRLLSAERSTLFLNDEKTGELWSEVGEGLESSEIRIPNTAGIAGAVFTSGETINIPYAYADLRFNPAVDRMTGFFTRSILCVPVINKEGKTIGVTQVLNKRGGIFSGEDESRLKAFSAQVSIGLENAKLFSDVQKIKNYNESMLDSMSNGVITLDSEGKIVTCNSAATRILPFSDQELLAHGAESLFAPDNGWVVDRVRRVDASGAPEIVLDKELRFGGGEVSVNLTVMPLKDMNNARIGNMLIMEDISSEKRIKSTMSRYMDPAIADQLLRNDQNILGGQSQEATILFSDIRGFTSITEALGAAGTVSLLNEYFTLMVDIIQQENGMLDKFIGDAIMAGFGIPIAHGDDEDRAVRAAIAMIRSLRQWNIRRASAGMPELDMGVGLNTDIVVSGNIGSPKRMDFTVIGDGVNLASRLESACKQYAAHILISGNTYRKLKGVYRTREVDLVVVKGKSEPVAVHEVLDYHSEQSFPNLMEALGHFKEGLASYRRRDWAKAKRSFSEAQRSNPSDRLPVIYLERTDHLERNPPADDWAGVWVMDSK